MANLIKSLDGMPAQSSDQQSSELKQKTDSRSARFLKAIAGSLPVTSVQAAANGKLAIVDGMYFVRKEITGKSVQPLIEAADKETRNVKNFDGNTLGTLVNMVVRRIEFRYFNALTSGTPTTTSGAYRAIRQEPNLSKGQTNTNAAAGTATVITPAGDGLADSPKLLNAELHIRVGGQVVLKVPVNRFNQAEPGQETSTKDGINIENLFVIKEGETIEAEIILPAAIDSPASSSHFVELTLKGSRTIAK